jgi:hypothetical protein
VLPEPPEADGTDRLPYLNHHHLNHHFSKPVHTICVLPDLYPPEPPPADVIVVNPDPDIDESEPPLLHQKLHHHLLLLL